MIDDLERRGGLDRTLEVLPGADEIAEREQAGEGLSSPELAVLLAHTKLDLKAEILRSDLSDLTEFAGRVADPFPAVLVERFPTGRCRAPAASRDRGHGARQRASPMRPDEAPHPKRRY